MKKYSRYENKKSLDVALKEKEEVDSIEKDLKEKKWNSEYYIDKPDGPDLLGYWRYIEEEWLEYTSSDEEMSLLDALMLDYCCTEGYITEGTLKQLELYKEYKKWYETKCTNTKYENELDEKEKEEYYSKLKILGLLSS